MPMAAVRDGLVGHLKKRWNTTDDTAGRELLVGKEPAGVELEF
jgi:hypothetical protein